MAFTTLLWGCGDDPDETESSCKNVRSESHYCAAVFYGSGRAIGLIGMDSGHVCLSSETEASGAEDIRSGAMINGHFYGCTDDGLTQIDIYNGNRQSSEEDCEAVDRFNGGLLTMRHSTSDYFDFYATFSLPMGTPTETFGPIDHRSSRMAVNGNTLYTAWHSTNEVERFDLPTGNFLRAITLEGYNGWIYGMSVTPDGILFINARGDEIRLFDADSGAALGIVPLATRSPPIGKPHGLACAYNP
jgi:hypothetical protein